MREIFNFVFNYKRLERGIIDTNSPIIGILLKSAEELILSSPPSLTPSSNYQILIRLDRFRNLVANYYLQNTILSCLSSTEEKNTHIYHLKNNARDNEVARSVRAYFTEGGALQILNDECFIQTLSNTDFIDKYQKEQFANNIEKELIPWIEKFRQEEKQKTDLNDVSLEYKKSLAQLIILRHRELYSKKYYRRPSPMRIKHIFNPRAYITTELGIWQLNEPTEGQKALRVMQRPDWGKVRQLS